MTGTPRINVAVQLLARPASGDRGASAENVDGGVRPSGPRVEPDDDVNRSMFEGTVIPDSVIAEAGRRLLAAAPEAQVILFGSAARGDMNKNSDLDFLVVEREVDDRHAEQVRLRRALRSLRIPVDVIVVSERYAEEWGPARGSMVHAALTEGRMVHAGT
jgi:predicted nucleotidyltransferase